MKGPKYGSQYTNCRAILLVRSQIKVQVAFPFNPVYFSNEMEYFIKQQKLPIKNTAKVHAKGGVRNSVMKADKYFSELTPDQVMKLYEIYKFDFQIFGYEHESYLELSKLEKNTNQKKNSFDLALEQVKKEGKYDEIKLKKKKNLNKGLNKNKSKFSHQNQMGLKPKNKRKQQSKTNQFP